MKPERKRTGWTLSGLGVLVAGMVLGALAWPIEAQQKNLLVSTNVAAAPALDGTLDDAWKGAAPLTVRAIGGRNLPGGSSEISLRSIY